MQVLVLLIAFVFCRVSSAAQQLPQTLITEVRSGKKVAFHQTIEKGKVTLISFWATWCVPGKREVKTIVHKMPEWKKQADFNYIAIAVDQQNTEELARKYAVSTGWTFPVYVDVNSELKRPLNFHALPYIIIIDKNGRIGYAHTGYESGEEILKKLKELAGKKEK